MFLSFTSSSFSFLVVDLPPPILVPVPPRPFVLFPSSFTFSPVCSRSSSCFSPSPPPPPPSSSSTSFLPSSSKVRPSPSSLSHPPEHVPPCPPNPPPSECSLESRPLRGGKGVGGGGRWRKSREGGGHAVTAGWQGFGSGGIGNGCEGGINGNACRLVATKHSKKNSPALAALTPWAAGGHPSCRSRSGGWSPRTRACR